MMDTTSEIIVFLPPKRRLVGSIAVEGIHVTINDIGSPHFVNYFARQAVSLPSTNGAVVVRM